MNAIEPASKEVSAIQAQTDTEAFRIGTRAWFETNLAAIKSEFEEPVSDFDLVFRRRWEDHLCRAGWSGLSWPKEYGGKAMPLDRQAIFHEEYARCGAPQQINTIGHGILGPTLVLYGTEEQKQRFLPKLLTNEEIWCQGYSEPGSGSDLAALATRAYRDGDHYRIKGQKIWTSYARWSDWCFVLVRTDPDAPKHRGISFVLVDMKTPGITVRPIRQITGEADFNEVFFDDVIVPVSNLVGAENKGWDIAMAAASFERSTYFIPRISRLQDELHDLVKLAAAMRRGGKPALDDPLIRDRLAGLFIDIHVLRLRGYQILAQSMDGKAPGPESSALKVAWSETHQRLLEMAMDLLGPRAQLGPLEPSAPRRGRWQRDYLWSRAETILAGTSEIQRNIIAERALGLPR